MLDRMVTKIEETVKEMMRLEEMMKHNVYVRSIAKPEDGDYDVEDRDVYVEHLIIEFDILLERHEKLDIFLREFCMSRYMPEE